MPSLRRLIPEEDPVVVGGMKRPYKRVVAASPDISVHPEGLLPLGVDPAGKPPRKIIFQKMQRRRPVLRLLPPVRRDMPGLAVPCGQGVRLRLSDVGKVPRR